MFIGEGFKLLEGIIWFGLVLEVYSSYTSFKVAWTHRGQKKSYNTYTVARSAWYLSLFFGHQTFTFKLHDKYKCSIEGYKFTRVKSRLHTVYKITNSVKNYTLCITLHTESKISHSVNWLPLVNQRMIRQETCERDDIFDNWGQQPYYQSQ